MKKLTALLLALVMVLAIGSTAMADDGNNYSGDTKTIYNATTGIPLTKTIVFFNKDNKQAYEPNISFTYTIAPDTSVPEYSATATTRDPNTTVTDKDGNTARVYQGVTGGVGNSLTIDFSADNAIVPATETGYEMTRTGNITVNASVFDAPGIYRYTITESDPGVTTKGLEARTDAYDNIRYLDVYVKNGETSGSYEVYGAVIYKKISTDSSATAAAEKSIEKTTTGKTTGYEPDVVPGTSGGTVDYTNDHTVDRYTTYNVTVKKAVDGSMGDKNHQFPFSFAIANSIDGARYTYQKDGAEAVATTEMTINSALGNTLTLKHDESFVIYGVPSNQTTDLTVTITEKNDTFDKYKVKADNDLLPEVVVNDGASQALSAWTMKQTDTMKTITVTNTLDQVSPTGVVLRFGPYFAMMIAGVALLIVARKRRTNKDED